MTDPKDWDAPTYDRIADPMTRWGSTVIDRLALRGDERVLDAGCGSGRVTELLLARWPGIQIVALDRSPSMLAECERRLRAHAERVEFVEADLGEPLPLDQPVDAVISTATFHWVRDHDALFRNLAAVMRPGALLVAQCGGKGNVGNVVAALRDLGADKMPWTFPTPAESEARLAAAGFTEIRAGLHAEPIQLEPGEPLQTYLATIVLRAHLAHEPARRRADLVQAVADRLPDGRINYVRLDLNARRANRGVSPA
jgi:trans-aconitate 2-methyltransferase